MAGKPHVTNAKVVLEHETTSQEKEKNYLVARPEIKHSRFRSFLLFSFGNFYEG